MSTRDGEPTGGPNEGASPDDPWRRPGSPPAPPARPSPQPSAQPPPPFPPPPGPSSGVWQPGTGNWGTAGAAPDYLGPPPTTPPPAGWRPPTVLRPQPPRQLPSQDPAAIDRAERGARTMTYGVGMIAGAVLLILVCLLCSRLVF